jgi:hypothetical protein
MSRTGRRAEHGVAHKVWALAVATPRDVQHGYVHIAVLSTPLMKTCRNPTIVTGLCPLEPMVLPESKIGREIIELLLVTGVPLANPALTTGLFLPARIWNG